MANDETWRGSDDAIRNLIAREIWRYQECEEHYGDFDKVTADGMGALIKEVAVDQAELIRAAILESPVLRARILSAVGPAVCAKCGCQTKGEVAWVHEQEWCHPCADTIDPVGPPTGERT